MFQFTMVGIAKFFPTIMLYFFLKKAEIEQLVTLFCQKKSGFREIKTDFVNKCQN